MKHYWLWIFISLAIGIIAAFVFTSAVNRMSEAPEDATDCAAGISEPSNIALNSAVFGILAFLVIWLITAITQRDLLDLL